VTATVEWVVQRGKATVARIVTRVEGSALAPVDGAVDGAVAGADVTLTLTPADAGALCDGSLKPSVAFMRGQMKMSGDPGVLLRVLPIADVPEHLQSLRDRLAAAIG
jgi:putative sterol carrier protein